MNPIEAAEAAHTATDVARDYAAGLARVVQAADMPPLPSTAMEVRDPRGPGALLFYSADQMHAYARTYAEQRIAAISAELERERMRLVACGVVATADTPESAAKARDMHPDYHSAACDDVARRVDECIALRAALAAQTREER